MKKVFMILCAAVVALVMTGCGAIGMVGAVYQNVTQPVTVTSNAIGHKVGTAKCMSILGIVALGDAGINEAAKNGGIKKISHVDCKAFSILGVYTTYEYFVYGE